MFLMLFNTPLRRVYLEGLNSSTQSGLPNRTDGPDELERSFDRC